MFSLTHLPLFVSVFFKGLPGVFKHRHSLMLIWIILLQSILKGQRTLADMSRCAPSHVTEWRFRRLLTASYWSVKLILYWLADEVIKNLPPPKNEIIYLIVDSSKKEKRGQKNPVAQKLRIRKKNFFGIRFVVLMLSWDVYRIPVDFEIILPKTDPNYKKENVLFLEMLERFTAPSWAKQIIVIGDTAFASKANINAIKARNKAALQTKKPGWGFVFAIAKTWNQENGKSLKNLATCLPKLRYKKREISALTGERRKSFWVYRKQTRLNSIGDVTIFLSKKRLNTGPKNTKMIVTNLKELTDEQVLDIYQRRWPVEILFKELKTGLGLGEQQVTKNINRIENSIGIAFLSYLFLLRMRIEDISPGKPWSIFQLKQNFTIQVITEQVHHTTSLKIKNILKSV